MRRLCWSQQGLVLDDLWHTLGERFEKLFDAHGLPDAIRSHNGAPFASSQGLLGLTRLSA